MRKSVLTESRPRNTSAGLRFLDLEQLAHVEVTSEDPAHPIEAALTLEQPTGWRAAAPGPQTIRLLFDELQSIRRVQLLFLEEREERHQEFVLSWSAVSGQRMREIVRQQYHFSPAGATRELEEYAVELEDVGVIELMVTPHTSGGGAHVSLAYLRLA